MAGYFPRLALPARLGGAAKIGDGRQWMSWIHIADLLRVIETVIDEPGWRGAVNAVAPGPERQGDFQRALARAYRRPFFLRIPGGALRLAMGEMAQLLVEGQRVAPQRLLQAGFEFRHFTLASALRDLDSRPTRAAQRCARRIAIAKSGSTVIARCVHTKSAATKSSPSAAICRCAFTIPCAWRSRSPPTDCAVSIWSAGCICVTSRAASSADFGAVLAIWARLPEYRRLASVFSWPPLRAVCETIYDHCVAPGLAYWARVRQSGVRT